MKAVYVRQGDVLNYTATAALERGDFVQLPARVGVASDDIPAGGTGIVHLVGVFSMPKSTSEAIAPGVRVYLDPAAQAVTATKGSLTVVAGTAAESAAASSPTVDVRIDDSSVQ